MRHIAALAACKPHPEAATTGARLDAEAFPHTGDSLTIDVSLGGVRVLPGSRGTVQVERWLRGKAATDGPSWSLRGGVLRLSADCSMVFGDCGARYHVKVPPGVRLSIEADDGVVLNGLDQDIDAVSRETIKVTRASGRLRLRAEGPVQGVGITSRDIRVRTDYGKIDMAFTSRPGKLDLESNDGPVTARVPSGTYAVTAVTQTGRRRTEVEHDR